MDNLKRRKASSYGHLLDNSIDDKDIHYDPLFLDDIELRSGFHRTVINLPSYMGSLIPYSRPSELKRECNVKFKQKHPDLDPNLTLSQIRKVKEILINVAIEGNIEFSSVAKSFAFFEKLILKHYVNDPKETNYARVLEILSKSFDISIKEIKENEFLIFTALEFNLQIPPEEYISHFERIFNYAEFSNMQEYLGEKMYHMWCHEIQDEID
ncbi:hypothetical protein O9G_004297 [Rozella allomycis CSF55]|uniref:Cyclin N-terminal domain-containing protein n=1 Tax=Rozella allomycis (strain CSF55) TaxID=988480 RepID=A0A075AWC3_ROZAC|nr:hypothetical protein O9G_004297 [Rozella allomycis CSF55]|eukprot:EPZ32854.1 hypothetical protein O9G_004297 [Rozella allomycis CSF55]